MGKDLTKIAQIKTVVLALLGLNLIGLSGCGQLTTKPVTASESTADASTGDATTLTTSDKMELNDINLSPEDMYRVLLAEMLVVKGDVASGFKLMNQVAVKTRQPKLAERSFKLSMATYDLKAIDSAATLWREVSPEEPLAWKASYIMQARNGKIEEAVSSWQSFQTLSSKDVEHDLMETAVRLTQAVQPENGMAFLQRLHQVFPQNLVMNYALGMAAESYRYFDVAIEQLDHTLQKLPKSEAAVIDVELKKQLFRESHHLLASAYLNSGQSEIGLVRLDGFLQNHPQDWQFQELYARMEVKVGRFELAEARYLKVVENEPDANTSKLSAALLMLEREAYQQAEALLKELASELPYRSSALYYLGLAAQRQQHFDQAKQYYQQITTRDYLLDARLHIAEIDFPKIGLTKTLAALDAISVTDVADQVKLLQAKAMFNNKAGEKQAAIALYDQAIALQDQKVALYLMQAMLFYELSLYEQYESNLKRALAIDGDDVEVLNALGYFYAEQKRELGFAQQLLEKALTLAPNRFYILDSRGWLAYQQGHYQEAETFLSQAFKLQVDEEVLIHLIQALWKLERYEDAKKLWVDYRDKFPQNKVLQSIIVDLMR